MQVPAPDEHLGYKTIWDHWASRVRATPDMFNFILGSVSEHAPFYQTVGIPTSFMMWSLNYVCIRD